MAEQVFEGDQPLKIQQKSDPIDLMFDIEESVVKLVDQLKEYIGSDLIQGFDLMEENKSNNSVAQYDLSNKYGFMWVAIANCLVFLDNQDIYQVFEENTPLSSIKPPYFKAQDKIKYVGFSRNQEDQHTVIQVGHTVHIYKTQVLYKKIKTQKPNKELPPCCLLVDNKKALQVVSLQNGHVRSSDSDTKITSAIYNQSGDLILATIYSMDNHIQIRDPQTLAMRNNIKLSFAEWCTHDFYRMYYLNDYIDGHLLMCGALFVNKDDIDSNYGKLFYVWIGSNIDQTTNLKQLKDSQRIKYYYAMDQQHLNDDDPPGFKLYQVANPDNKADQFGLLAMSHGDELYQYKIKDNILEEFFYYSGGGFYKNPKVQRPDGADDCENPCVLQGFVMMKVKIDGYPQTYQQNLGDSEIDFVNPPRIFMYGLNGQVRVSTVLLREYKDKVLCQDREQININAVREEEKKEESKQQSKLPQTQVPQPITETQPTQQLTGQPIGQSKVIPQTQDQKPSQYEPQDSKSQLNPQEEQKQTPTLIGQQTTLPNTTTQQQPQIPSTSQFSLQQKPQQTEQPKSQQQQPQQQQQSLFPASNIPKNEEKKQGSMFGTTTSSLFPQTTTPQQNKVTTITSQTNQSTVLQQTIQPPNITTPQQNIIQITAPQPNQTQNIIQQQQIGKPTISPEQEFLLRKLQDIDNEITKKYNENFVSNLQEMKNKLPNYIKLTDSLIRAGVKRPLIEKIFNIQDQSGVMNVSQEVEMIREQIKGLTESATRQRVEQIRLEELQEKLQKMMKSYVYTEKGMKNLSKIQMSLFDFLVLYGKDMKVEEQKKLIQIEENVKKIQRKANQMNQITRKMQENSYKIIENARPQFNNVQKNHIQAAQKPTFTKFAVNQNKLNKLIANAARPSLEQQQPSNFEQKEMGKIILNTFINHEKQLVNQLNQQSDQNLIDISQKLNLESRQSMQQLKSRTQHSGKYGYFADEEEQKHQTQSENQSQIYDEQSQYLPNGQAQNVPPNLLTSFDKARTYEELNQKMQRLRQQKLESMKDRYKQERFMRQLDKIFETPDKIEVQYLYKPKYDEAMNNQQIVQQNYLKFISQTSQSQQDLLEKEKDFQKIENYLFLDDQQPKEPSATNLDLMRLQQITNLDNGKKLQKDLSLNQASFNTFEKKMFGDNQSTGIQQQQQSSLLQKSQALQSLDSSFGQQKKASEPQLTGKVNNQLSGQQQPDKKSDTTKVNQLFGSMMSNDQDNTLLINKAKEEKKKKASPDEMKKQNQLQATQQQPQPSKPLVEEKKNQDKTTLPFQQSLFPGKQEDKKEDIKKDASKTPILNDLKIDIGKSSVPEKQKDDNQKQLQQQQPIIAQQEQPKKQTPFIDPKLQTTQKPQQQTEVTNLQGPQKPIVQVQQQQHQNLSLFGTKTQNPILSNNPISAQLENKTFGTVDAAQLAALQQQQQQKTQGVGHVFGQGTSLLQGKAQGSGLTFSSYSSTQPANFGSIAQQQQNQPATFGSVTQQQNQPATFGQITQQNKPQQQQPPFGQQPSIFGQPQTPQQQQQPNFGQPQTNQLFPQTAQQQQMAPLGGQGPQQQLFSSQTFTSQPLQQQQTNPLFQSQPPQQFSQMQSQQQTFGQQQPFGGGQFGNQNVFGNQNIVGGGGYGEQDTYDFGQAVTNQNQGFMGPGPTFDQNKFKDPKFAKARK